MSRNGKIAIIAGLLAVLSFIAIPNLLSTSIVKQRVAKQLSDITGRKVSLNGSSSVSLSPYLGVAYDDVTISDERDEKGKPLVAMEGIRARLGLLAALWGDAKFTEIEFIRPQFNLYRHAHGQQNWGLDRGLVAVELAKGPEEKLSRLSLGTVKVVDGIVLLNDAQNRTTQQLTSLNGSVSWPGWNAELDSALNAVWNGEVVDMTLTIADPVAFLRGADSGMTGTLLAKPLQVKFSGTANSNEKTAHGTLSVSSESPQRLTSWLKWPIEVAEKFGNISISGPVEISGASAEFQTAALGIGNHSGEGRLQIAHEGQHMMKISGTLAFDTLTLPLPHEIFAAPVAKNETKKSLDFAALEGLAADLRLSATTATIGALAVEQLAASVLIRDGTASFDIGDAKALGGTIAGSLDLKSDAAGVLLSSDVTMNDVDLDSLTRFNDGGSAFVEGKGNARFKLRSKGKTADGLRMRLNGEGEITGRDGSMTGFDFNRAFNTAEGREAVAKLTSETTPFEELKIGFFIANGTAFLRDSYLNNDEVSVSLKGRGDLVRESLALRGVISKRATEPESAEPSEENSTATTGLPFFIGGTLSSPLFVPLPVVPDEKKKPDTDASNPKALQ